MIVPMDHEGMCTGRSASVKRARELVGRWAEQHPTFEDTILGWFATFRRLHRLEIDPLQWRGWVARLRSFIALLFGVPLLPLGGTLQLATTLFLPTVTFVLSVAGEAYLGMLMDRSLR
jgi:hypothetical protein